MSVIIIKVARISPIKAKPVKSILRSDLVLDCIYIPRIFIELEGCRIWYCGDNVHDIRNAGLFIFGVTLVAFAFYSLYFGLRRSGIRSKLNGVIAFLCLGSVGIVVIGLAMQLWGRKC